MKKYRFLCLGILILSLMAACVLIKAKLSEHGSEASKEIEQASMAATGVPESSGKNRLVNENLKGYTIIMHTNDTHGRVTADAELGQMGFAAVSALKKEYEAAGAQVILLDAGDTLHGTAFALNDRGSNIVSIMNKIGYTAMVPGNNDFNYGAKVLLERSEQMQFHLLSANISKTDGSSFLKQHMLVEANGITYGVFGLTTTDTVKMQSAPNIEGLQFEDPVDSAKLQVEELKKEGAEFVIGLMHMGVDDSSEVTSKMIAQKVEGIDLIVDGHSHTAFEKGLPVGKTLIVSAGQYIEHIGVVTIPPGGGPKAELIDAGTFEETDTELDDWISKCPGQEDDGILD